VQLGGQQESSGIATFLCSLLLKAVDKLTRMRKTTRSALNRSALEAELQQRHCCAHRVDDPQYSD
jgi:hypothetical protein